MHLPFFKEVYMIKEFNYMSNQLMHPTTVKIILPNDGNIKYSMYFLHGSLCDAKNCLDNFDTEKIANKYNMAIIIPDCGNSFYIDHGMARGNYGKFVGRELVDVTRNQFDLPKEREKTFIAGFSMGGYGAVRNGLLNNKNFGNIITLSGALLFEKRVDLLDDGKFAFLKKKLFEEQFGEFIKPGNHDKDYHYLLEKLIDNREELPNIYITVGENEELLRLSEDFHVYLNSLNVPHKYETAPGYHNWDFWRERIEPAIDWCMSRLKDE